MYWLQFTVWAVWDTLAIPREPVRWGSSPGIMWGAEYREQRGKVTCLGTQSKPGRQLPVTLEPNRHNFLFAVPSQGLAAEGSLSNCGRDGYVVCVPPTAVCPESYVPEPGEPTAV